MNKKLIFLLALTVISINIFAQDATAASEEEAYLQDILNQKNEIYKLTLVDDQKAINKRFRKKEKLLTKLYSKNDVEAYKVTFSETRVIFADVPFLKSDVLYYRGELAFLRGQYQSAQQLFEELISEYYNSRKNDDAILKLAEIYAASGQDEKLAEIYGSYGGKKNPQLNFWYAQANYNMGDYLKAKRVFSEIKKKDFRFRAKLMLALISYLEDGTEAGLIEFRNIEKKYKPKTPYYSFVYLSLARILMEMDQPEASLHYYNKYHNLKTEINSEIADDILFEMAVENKNYQNYSQAKSLFQEVIAKTNKSSYYAPSKYYLSLTEQEEGNFELAEDNLQGLVESNNLLIKTLSSKYKLVEKYDQLALQKSSDDITEIEKATLNEKMLGLELATMKTNLTVRDLYTGERKTDVKAIALLEQEIFSYSSTVSDMEAVIKLAYTSQNKRIPRIIDGKIARNDSSIVTLQIIKYIGHLKNSTPGQYELARMLTLERFAQEDLQQSWIDIDRYARAKNRADIGDYATRSLGILDANIKALDLIAKYLFKGEPSEEVKGFIAEELNALRVNNEKLEGLKLLALENFNKKIAKRLEAQQEILVDEFAVLKQTYNQSIKNIMEEVRLSNIQYEENLLDLLFQQSIYLDEQYQEKQKEYSDSNHE